MGSPTTGIGPTTMVGQGDGTPAGLEYADPAPLITAVATPEALAQPGMTALAEYIAPDPLKLAELGVPSVGSMGLGALLGMLLGRLANVIPGLSQNPAVRDAALGAAVAASTAPRGADDERIQTGLPDLNQQAQAVLPDLNQQIQIGPYL